MKAILRNLTIVVSLIPAAHAQQKDLTMDQEFMNVVVQGDLARVKDLLLKDPALARSTDTKGVSAVLKATYYGKKDVVAVLLASGLTLNVFEAAATGQTARLQSLLKAEPSLANVFASDGFMPLGLAVFFGHRDAVEVLLAAGADVNAATRESMKVTPLHSAVASRNIEIARRLIAHGANVRATAENDFTPLHEAAAIGNIEFVTLLLDKGADINARTKDGKTPLRFALDRKQDEMAKFLRERGATE